jgi:hypothetical protein
MSDKSFERPRQGRRRRRVLRAAIGNVTPMSLIGTFATCRLHRAMSVHGGPKTAYSLRGIVPQIRRPRAERGACQSAEVRIFARRRGGGITRTGADAPQGMMAVHQPGRLMRRGPGGV